MKKATSILKLSLLATVLFLWTNASAQGITETESISCPGRTDGQLSFTASAAGEAGNTYLWSDGSTGKTLKKVGAGTYSVTVTGPDAGPYSYTISDPIQLTIAPTTTANTIWGPNPSDCDGTISPNKNPNGGTGTITYHLYDELARDSFTTTADPIIDLVPGNYNIYAVDENGCSTTSTTITVIDANESTLTEMPSDTTYVCYKMMTGGSVRPAHDDIFPVSASFYDENGSLIVTETADYYVLDTTAVSGTIYAANYIPSIDYWEIPVSSNSVGDTILLLSKNPISSPAGYPNSDYLFVASQTLIDSLDVMQPDSTYIRQEINRNSFTTKPSTLASGDLTPGFYMAYYWSSEVPNPKGVRSAWDILAPDNPVTINYTQTDVPCYGDATGAISASAQGSWHDYGVPFTSLSISGNGYSQTVSSVNQIASPASLAAGIYSITATDIQGCSRTQTVEIAQPDEELRIEFDQAKKAKCPYSYDGEAMIHRVEGCGWNNFLLMGKWRNYKYKCIASCWNT